MRGAVNDPIADAAAAARAVVAEALPYIPRDVRPLAQATLDLVIAVMVRALREDRRVIVQAPLAEIVVTGDPPAE